MDGQRFSILGRVWTDEDPEWQTVLARVHDTAERPRCLCVPGGVEMYVARHRLFLVKRMPQTGSRHHPGCLSYELPAQSSGLGELLGDAVQVSADGGVTLRVDFPWVRTGARGVGRGEAGVEDSAEVAVAGRRLSLRALMHFLFERAGFNRWTPAMAGKRNQAVLHKHLMEAAAGVVVKGETLAGRLYVPEPFQEATRAQAAERRRRKLALLRPAAGGSPLALVMGEFKTSDEVAGGRRVWVRHLPDVPLLVEARTWQRFERAFAAALQARDADTGYRVRLMLLALVRARRAYTYEIDAASLMLASQDWLPLEGVHELPLIAALVAQGRRFVKPLRYDARSAAGFSNALLLDAGPAPVALHLLSGFMAPAERLAKERAIAEAGDAAWVWDGEPPLPALPPVGA